MQHGYDNVGSSAGGTPGYGVGEIAGCEIAGGGESADVKGAKRLLAAARGLPDRRPQIWQECRTYVPAIVLGEF